MSCTSHTYPVVFVAPAPTRVRVRWPAFVKTIVVVFEAFQEALEMRRAAHRARPFDEE